MAIDKVREYFKQYNLDNRIIEFETSAATVELAAANLNCEPDKIAKTMSFLIEEKPLLIVLSGTTEVDNAKYKNEFGTKAKMIHLEDVEKIIGHEPGSVCPFALKDGIDVFLDISLKKHKSVYPSCGGVNSAILLSIPELEKYSNYLKWVDVGKENK